jgi:hypothetical protein
MIPDIDALRRGHEANQKGCCVLCAYQTGQEIKAAQKMCYHGNWMGLCNHHAMQMRYENRKDVK